MGKNNTYHEMAGNELSKEKSVKAKKTMKGKLN
jgi:hypothetical protein